MPNNELEARAKKRENQRDRLPIDEKEEVWAKKKT
jgi:hypothetical protein